MSIEAMKLALEALEFYYDQHGEEKDAQAITALRRAIEREEQIAQSNEEVDCSDHPDAPHGFDRDRSHTLGRYVCECEGWRPEGKT
jgi:hypothetical protein